MLATATNPYSMDGALYGTSASLMNDLQDVSRSGKYYVTPELAREFSGIQRGVEHIRLDNQFMKSPHWSRKFASSRSDNTAGAASAMGKAAGVISNVKSQLNAERINEQQENDIRQTHYWAVNNLRAAQQDMSPYVNASADRIHQFCDHIGVTDRYTGYRHNLNRGNRDPVKLGFQWLDTNKNQYNNSLNVGWRPGDTRPSTMHNKSQTVRFADTRTEARSAPVLGRFNQTGGTVHHINTAVNQVDKSVAYSPKSIQEQCGINTTFPGKTEYMFRYVAPPPEDLSRGFNVNPSQNFLIHGRPLAKTSFDPCHTEYQTRYEWPDSRKIAKLPWLRK